MTPPPDTPARQVNGGRFDFDDGGTYCGGWEDGKAHGHGVCTGPKAQGEYSGSWHYGFEVSGVYTWPSGSTYEGHWQNGRRHGLGVETRGRWAYRGEWTQGFKGRYGVRQSTTSAAKYEGTWANGLQDGYGSETYADSGTYQGQWQRGSRHGYGVRTSAAFGTASTSRGKAHHGSASSLKSDRPADPTSERDRRVNETRGGFVLKARSDEPPARRGSMVEKSTTLRKNILQGLRLRKQRSTGDLEKRNTGGSIRSTNSSTSWMSSDSTRSHITNGSYHTESNASFVVEDEQMDSNVTETYMGEWKNDRRIGYGVCERSDGLKYEGEWYNNKKYGYGVTTFRDGTREEGKYKNNVLVTSNKKKHLFLIRSAKFRERIEAAVSAASRGSKIALQKADIAISRTATARGKAEQADIAAQHAREDSGMARVHAKQFAPDFLQPGSEGYKSRPEARGASVEPGPTTAASTAAAGARLRVESHAHELTQSELTPAVPPPPPPPPNGLPPGLSVSPMPPPPPLPPSEPMGGRRLSEAVSVGASTRATAAALARQDDRTSVDYFPAALTSRASAERDRGGSTGGCRSRASLYGSSSGAGSGSGGGPTAVLHDRFDHYRRAPSRDGSAEPGGRGWRRTPQPSELAVRAPSAGRSADWTPDSGVSETMDEVAVMRPHAADITDGPHFFVPETPEQAAMLLRQTSSNSMKRTESMVMPGPQGRRGGKPSLTSTTLQRKKSMPDAAMLTVKARVMPREEANFLAATQRETLRREAELEAMYRANPLLYLTNPKLKDWFSRQRLVLAVIIINISLAVLFLKLMT